MELAYHRVSPTTLRNDPILFNLDCWFYGVKGYRIVGYRLGTGTVVLLLTENCEDESIIEPTFAAKIFGVEVQEGRFKIKKLDDTLIEKVIRELKYALRFGLHAYLVAKPTKVFKMRVYEGDNVFVIPALLMPFYPFNLRDFMGKVEEKLSLSLMAQVAFTLHQLEEVGFTHYDLKPENILIKWLPVVNEKNRCEIKWRAYISDFGNVDVYKKGVRRGSWPYMAPEQYEKKEVIHPTRVPVFALGVMLTELLTGRHPYGKPTLELWRPIGSPEHGMLGEQEWKDWAVSDKRVACYEIADEQLRECVIKALSPDPLKRPSAGEFYQHILNALKRIDSSYARELESELLALKMLSESPLTKASIGFTEWKMKHVLKKDLDDAKHEVDSDYWRGDHNKDSAAMLLLISKCLNLASLLYRDKRKEECFEYLNRVIKITKDNYHLLDPKRVAHPLPPLFESRPAFIAFEIIQRLARIYSLVTRGVVELEGIKKGIEWILNEFRDIPELLVATYTVKAIILDDKRFLETAVKLCAGEEMKTARKELTERWDSVRGYLTMALLTDFVVF